MRSRRAVLILSLFIAGLFALALFVGSRLPQQPLIDGDNMGITQFYRLDSTVDDSLFIVADKVELLPNSHITGDAAFVSSDVEMSGRIDGDLTVTGETVVLRPGAYVGGDVLLVANGARLDGEVSGDITFSGNQLVLAADFVLNGDIALCSGDILDQRPGAVTESQPCTNLDVATLLESFRANVMLQSGAVAMDAQGRFTFVLAGTILAAFGLAALATLSVALFPRQLGAMSTALQRPHSQFLTGLLTVLLLVGLGAAVVFLVALVPALSIVLAPLSFIIGVAFVALVLAGTIPMTLGIGGWLLRRVSSAQWPPLVAATIGSLTLVLVVCLPAFVPYGALVTLAAIGLIGTVAVGAALSTRLGTRGQRATYFVQG